MSDTSTNPHAVHGDHHGHGHDPHLAHHFDSMGQQFDAGKLGMWVFLATEILMFGGLFCAYAVYRANHPEVFYYAHHFLNTTLGGINTVVLIASSLTMAWAVRASQLGQQKLLVMLLALTVAGGFGFLCIKTIEYNTKAHHDLWLGTDNLFHPEYKGDRDAHLKELEGGHGGGAHAKPDVTAKEETRQPDPVKPDPATTGQPESSAIAAPSTGPQGVTSNVITRAEEAKAPKHPQEYTKLAERDQKNVYTFFLIYFCMTGLHSFHVIVGMFLIFWLVVRAARPGDRKWIRPLFPAASGLFLVYVGIVTHSTLTMIIGVALAGLFGLLAMLGVRGADGNGDQTGDFGPMYFAPVDTVGLY